MFPLIDTVRFLRREKPCIVAIAIDHNETLQKTGVREEMVPQVIYCLQDLHFWRGTARQTRGCTIADYWLDSNQYVQPAHSVSGRDHALPGAGPVEDRNCSPDLFRTMLTSHRRSAQKWDYDSVEGTIRYLQMTSNGGRADSSPVPRLLYAESEAYERVFEEVFGVEVDVPEYLTAEEKRARAKLAKREKEIAARHKAEEERRRQEAEKRQRRLAEQKRLEKERQRKLEAEMRAKEERAALAKQVGVAILVVGSFVAGRSFLRRKR